MKIYKSFYLGKVFLNIILNLEFKKDNIDKKNKF